MLLNGILPATGSQARGRGEKELTEHENTSVARDLKPVRSRPEEVRVQEKESFRGFWL